MPLQIHVRRHAHREVGPGLVLKKPKLTKEGIKAALELGKSIKGQTVKAYSSPSDRSHKTARLIKRAAGSTYKVQKRSDLGQFVKPTTTREQLTKIFAQSDEAVIREWLDGKLNEYLYTPHETALYALRSMRFAPKAAAKLGEKHLRIESVAHDVTVIALFQALTEEKANMDHHSVHFLEELKLDLTPDKVTLTFKDKTFDVTKRFNQLLEESKKLVD